jgi:hypothetical protein
MASLFFLLGVVSIAVVVFWEIRNDGVAPDGATTGLLAMRPEPGAPDPSGPAPPARTRRTGAADGSSRRR